MSWGKIGCDRLELMTPEERKAYEEWKVEHGHAPGHAPGQDESTPLFELTERNLQPYDIPSGSIFFVETPGLDDLELDVDGDKIKWKARMMIHVPERGIPDLELFPDKIYP